MKEKVPEKRPALLVFAIVGICVAIAIGIFRIRIDNDITTVIPGGDPVIQSTRDVIKINPVWDRIVIDLGNEGGPDDPELLVAAANYVSEQIAQIPYLENVSMVPNQSAAADLPATIIEHLPQLFSKKEIEKEFADLISEKNVRHILEINLRELAGMNGIGQAELISKDPLRLRERVFMRMAGAVPLEDISIYKAHLLSGDGRHILLMAKPKTSGVESGSARKIRDAMENISEGLKNIENGRFATVRLTDIGAYRAAIDNETTIRQDASRAMIIVTIGVGLLLFLTFRRPWLAGLAFLPAILGMGLALFVYSLVWRTISAIALGFAGALISITIDAAIAFLLFLDSGIAKDGKEASRKVFFVSLFAALTTVGAFLALTISDFPLLKQLGLIAALGVAFSFLIVHTFFPLLIPRLKSARRKPALRTEKILGRAARLNPKHVFIAAILLVIVLAPFVRPDFHIDMNSMNSVKDETLAAERTVADTWGNVMGQTYIVASANSEKSFHAKLDSLAAFIDELAKKKQIEPAFSPSDLFPGTKRSAENLQAWKSFWTSDRVVRLKEIFNEVAPPLGFETAAFAQFFNQLESPVSSPVQIPSYMAKFFGINKSAKTGQTALFSPITPGKSYDGELLYLEATKNGLLVYDPKLFSEKLAALLANTFQKMFLIIGITVTILVAFLFVDWRLVLLSIAPLGFSLWCTFGVMNLIGRPLELPGLMLSVVILGMGIDYSLYTVRSYQKFSGESQAAISAIGSAVFLNAGSTIIGMASLIFANHSLLKNAGITATVALLFVCAGTFLILPPFLSRLYKKKPLPVTTGKSDVKTKRALTFARFAHYETYPRLFAFFKMRMDPMFEKLSRFMPEEGLILDIGCGYAMPAAWLSATAGPYRFHCYEPYPNRAAFASKIIGDGGKVVCGSAPELPDLPKDFNAAMMLDVAHYLNDSKFSETLARVRDSLEQGGLLVLRITIPSGKRTPPARRIETIRLWLSGQKPCYRTVDENSRIIVDSGFTILTVEQSAEGREETWFVGQKQDLKQ